MKKILKSNLSIVLAFFCLMSFFPFYALGYMKSEAWPVPKAKWDMEGGKIAQAGPLPAQEPSSEAAPATKPRNPLLDRFKPELGWGPERREEIKIKTIRGAKPDPEEMAFFLCYKDWASALEEERASK